MNASTPFKFTAVGVRWPVAKSTVASQPARRERPEAGAGTRHDPHRMPNGDPPPATLWGTDPGE
jgi:hypothetical protein